LQEGGTTALAKALGGLLVDEDRLKSMREAMKGIARPEAAGLVAAAIMRIARSGEDG